MKKLLNKSKSTVIPPLLLNSVFITDARRKCELFNESVMKTLFSRRGGMTVDLLLFSSFFMAVQYFFGPVWGSETFEPSLLV
jgi:hypothetical protein